MIVLVIALIAVIAAGATGALALVNSARDQRTSSARGAVSIQAQQTAQAALATRAATRVGTDANRYQIVALSMDSPIDGWAVEVSQVGESPAILLHIANGAAVQVTTLALQNAFSVVLQALSPANVWLLTPGSASSARFDGHGWTQSTLPKPPDAVAGGIALDMFQMRSATEGWAIASYTATAPAPSNTPPPMRLAFYRYDRAAWRLDPADAAALAGAVSEPQQPDDMAPIQITGMSITPGGDVWVTGSAQFAAVQQSSDVAAYGLIYHRAGGVWRVQRLNNRELYGIVMTGPSDGWIIGSTDKVIQLGSDPIIYETNQTPMALRWDGARWSPAALPALAVMQATARLAQVVAASPTDVWISGAPTGTTYDPNSANATNNDYLVHFDGWRWSRASEPQVAAINPTHDLSIGASVSFGYLAAPAPGVLWLAGSLTIIQNGDRTPHPLIYSGTAGQWTPIPMPAPRRRGGALQRPGRAMKGDTCPGDSSPSCPSCRAPVIHAAPAMLYFPTVGACAARNPHNAVRSHDNHMTDDTTYILVERDGPVATLTINRPDKLNALNWALIGELATRMEELDRDDAIRCLVITGAGEKAFAAGADIAEMANASPAQMAFGAFEGWNRISRIRKPIIAAVEGYALGGGNELAMHADIIIASEKAKFGQPEILLGVMPGAGGTQRLARTLGKYRAMEICLSGDQFTAQQMADWGLVNHVVAPGQALAGAQALATKIATHAPIATAVIKEAVLAAFETPLAAGLIHEKRLFAMLFSTDDQKEGMAAFMEKRPPKFTGK
jgi:enoyl-CoA hydratase